MRSVNFFTMLSQLVDTAEREPVAMAMAVWIWPVAMPTIWPH